MGCFPRSTTWVEESLSPTTGDYVQPKGDYLHPFRVVGSYKSYSYLFGTVAGRNATRLERRCDGRAGENVDQRFIGVGHHFDPPKFPPQGHVWSLAIPKHLQKVI